MKINVRPATLDDVAQIVDVHVSGIEWSKEYDSLSISERWTKGGPWMSIETFSIHLNFLLSRHQHVLVAHNGERLIGECEFIIGYDCGAGRKQANLSVLYVHPLYQRVGVGSALVKATEQIAIEEGCSALTVYNPASVTYYERHGLTVVGQQYTLVVPCQQLRSSYSASTVQTLPEYKCLKGLWLVAGEYQSSRHMYLDYLLNTQVMFALPFPEFLWQHTFKLQNNNRTAYCVIYPITFDKHVGKVLLYAEKLTVDLLRAILSRGKELGFAKLHFLINSNHVPIFCENFTCVDRPQQIVMSKSL